MRHHETFADRLIAAEHVDAKQKERYRMELQQILNQTLTPAKWIMYALGAVLGLFVAIDFGVLATTLHMTGEYAAWGRAVFGVVAVFGLVWAVLAGRIAIRGRVNLRKDQGAIVRLVWHLSVLICIVTLFIGWLELRYGSGKWSVFITVIGLAYLIGGAVFAIKNLVQQSELRVREKLLEIELRLAEMDGKLGKGSGAG